MLLRVNDLSYEADVQVRQMQSQLLSSWRRYEVDNMIRNNGAGEKDREVAELVYKFCKLMDPPRVLPGDKIAQKEVLSSPERCPWACVRILHMLRAFNFAPTVRPKMPTRRLPATSRTAPTWIEE